MTYNLWKRALWNFRLMTPLLAALFLLAAACSEATEPVDSQGEGEHESFLAGGKADFHTGVEEGSLEAQGILLIVNTFSFEELDSFLDVRSARSIIAFRSGPDGILGTSDDRVIYNLAALDALSWVGPDALRRLRDHMIEHDLIPREGALVHGIQEGGPAAIGMLVVVNTLTFEELDDFLDVRAVEGIIDYREGGTTQGKRYFRTLQSLDAVPYMGPTAFASLLGYAQDNDYIIVDVLDPTQGEEFYLTGVELTGKVKELSETYDESNETFWRMALEGFEVSSSQATTAQVTEIVRQYHDQQDNIDQPLVEKREDYIARFFLNNEVVNAVELTYGTDYQIGELKGRYSEGSGEWSVEIVVFHFAQDQLAIVYTNEQGWD